ncbi:tetratricopeptide repeat protein [Planctomycetota bacterium]
MKKARILTGAILAGLVLLSLNLWQAGIPSVAAQEEQEEVEFYIDEAEESFAETDFEDVAELLEEGLGYYPDNGYLLDLSSRLAWRTGEYARAMEICGKLLTQGFKKADVLMTQARVLFETGKYGECLTTCDAIISLKEFHLRARLLKGEALDILGRDEEMRDCFSWFLGFYRSRKKLNDEEYYAVARACYFLKRWQDTSAMYDRALSQNNEHVDALVGHAEVLIEKNNPTRANERLRKARKVKSYDPHVLAVSAYYEASQRRMEGADKLLKRAFKVNPHYPEALEVRAFIEIGRENYDKGIADCKKALEVNPNDITARSLMGAVYYITGETEKFNAERDLVFKFNEKCSDFYFIIGSLLAAKLMVQESSEILEKALKLEPDNYYIHHILGVAYMRLGESERGRELLSIANRNDPYNAATYNYLELLDKMEDKFTTVKSEHFVIRLEKAEAELMGPYLVYLAEKAYDTLPAKYGATLSNPIIMESFRHHPDFAVRTIGTPGIGALGACWGKLVTLYSPQPPPPDNPMPPMMPFSWAVTAWHEIVHVVHLHMSRNRISRWLAEGNAVYEQDKVYSSWDRDMEVLLVHAYYKKELPEIRKFNEWFFDRRIGFAYYLGAVYNEFIAQEYGFDKLVELLNASKSGRPTVDLILEVLKLTAAEFDKGFYNFVGKQVGQWKFAPVYSMKVIEEMQMQLADDAGNVVLLARLADGFSAVGIDVDSEIALHKAMKLQPDHPEVLFARARIAFRAKDMPNAIKYYEEARKQGMDNFQLRFQLGKHYLEKGKKENTQELIDMGVAHLEKAVEFFPVYIDPGCAFDILIKHYEASGAVEDAMRLSEQYTDVMHLGMARLFSLAEYYEHTKNNPEKAIHYYWQMVMVNPWVKAPHAPLAKLLYESGDFERAALEYNALHFFEPDNLPYAIRLARCFIKLGRRGEAYRLAKELAEEHPDNKDIKEILEILVD